MAKFKTPAEAVKYINQNKSIRIVANTNTHGFPMGPMQVIAARTNGTTNSVAIDTYVSGTLYSYNIKLSDMEGAPLTKEEILEGIKSLKERIAAEEVKLKFIESTGSAVYDETEFKVYQTLQTLKGKKSDAEKARVIAQLINQQ